MLRGFFKLNLPTTNWRPNRLRTRDLSVPFEGFFLLDASCHKQGARRQLQLVQTWVLVQKPATGQHKWSSHTKVNAIHAKVIMPLFLHPLNDGMGKCDVQKCPFATVAVDAYTCGIDECTKKVHVECYTRLVLVQVGKKALPPFPTNVWLVRKSIATQ